MDLDDLYQSGIDIDLIIDSGLFILPPELDEMRKHPRIKKEYNIPLGYIIYTTLFYSPKSKPPTQLK